MLLKNAGGENIRVYCILDSDYHTPEQIRDRLQQAKSHQVELHVWTNKEIENYLLVPAVIARTIASRAAKRVDPPKEQEVAERLDAICQCLRDEAFDSLATEILSQNRGYTQGTANKFARAILDDRWKTPASRLSAISGKTALSQLSQWSQEQFAVSLSTSAIAKQFKRDELSSEMRSVLESIATCGTLPAAR